jgi:hypothetical protein
MSVVDATRREDRFGANASFRPATDSHDDIDVPGVSASHIASLYAHGERERRDAGVERAIARARGAS